MLAAHQQLQTDTGEEMESDEEEPAPEALMRYMAMRRHTIGVGDSEHDTPQDARTKLAQHKPIIGETERRPVTHGGETNESSCMESDARLLL